MRLFTPPKPSSTCGAHGSGDPALTIDDEHVIMDAGGERNRDGPDPWRRLVKRASAAASW